ncbi:hypothetical protein C8R43DRAFT_572638 [Mycena crocata]|nr:hypothetical protein C8R43DRAFT_572638 [Mycena crocata]
MCAAGQSTAPLVFAAPCSPNDPPSSTSSAVLNTLGRTMISTLVATTVTPTAPIRSILTTRIRGQTLTLATGVTPWTTPLTLATILTLAETSPTIRARTRTPAILISILARMIPMQAPTLATRISILARMAPMQARTRATLISVLVPMQAPIPTTRISPTLTLATAVTLWTPRETRLSTMEATLTLATAMTPSGMMAPQMILPQTRSRMTRTQALTTPSRLMTRLPTPLRMRTGRLIPQMGPILLTPTTLHRMILIRMQPDPTATSDDSDSDSSSTADPTATSDDSDSDASSAAAADPTATSDDSESDASSAAAADPAATSATSDSTDSSDAAAAESSSAPAATADSAGTADAPASTSAASDSLTCGAAGPNAATINLIKQFEGFVPSPAPDPIGLPTVGFGHKCTSKGCAEVGFSFPLSQSTAAQLLQQDVQQFVTCVNSAVSNSVTLTDNQLGALTAFSFNVGCGALKSSTLVKQLNAGQDPNTVAAAQLPRFNKAGGKVLAGLTKRRAAEVALFQTPSQVKAHPC